MGRPERSDPSDAGDNSPDGMTAAGGPLRAEGFPKRRCQSDIAIESSYKLSNEREIHDELIKQAVANSKHRAEAIAATVGKKIIGIKSVSMNSYGEDSIRYCDMLAPDSLRYEKPKSLDLSNQLAANSTTESESVDVEWIID